MSKTIASQFRRTLADNTSRGVSRQRLTRGDKSYTRTKRSTLVPDGADGERETNSVTKSHAKTFKFNSISNSK